MARASSLTSRPWHRAPAAGHHAGLVLAAFCGRFDQIATTQLRETRPYAQERFPEPVSHLVSRECRRIVRFQEIKDSISPRYCVRCNSAGSHPARNARLETRRIGISHDRTSLPMPARSAMSSARAGSTRYRRAINWPAGVLGWTIANGYGERADGWDNCLFWERWVRFHVQNPLKPGVHADPAKESCRRIFICWIWAWLSWSRRVPFQAGS
jgi:hypothetical protein